MAKDYRVVFTIEPMTCHFHFRCKAKTKEEAGQKARVEIQNAVTAIHTALKPFEMDPAWGVYSHLYLVEYRVGKRTHREDLKGSIAPAV